MIVNPLGSYSIDLPDDALQEIDERVFSVWRPGSHVAVQLSSYERLSGEQVGAEDRLKELMERSGGTWEPIERKLSIYGNPKVAGAKTVDEEGFAWTHVYIVWPRFAIYALLSKPPYEDDGSLEWALKALNSLRAV